MSVNDGKNRKKPHIGQQVVIRIAAAGFQIVDKIEAGDAGHGAADGKLNQIVAAYQQHQCRQIEKNTADQTRTGIFFRTENRNQRRRNRNGKHRENQTVIFRHRRQVDVNVQIIVTQPVNDKRLVCTVRPAAAKPAEQSQQHQKQRKRHRFAARTAGNER